MEVGNMARFFEGKNLLITGATGFLAKILVEKILRTQPDVKKLYLLIRTTNTKSATQRFYDEIIGLELFKLLKKNWGENFSQFISTKVFPVSGDVSLENLGIEIDNLKQEIWKDVDFIIDSAATTKFDERYDVSLGINTFGAMHILNFAKKCVKLKVLLHVSTAYVCGEWKGEIAERPFTMGETVNGVTGLDINEEKKLMEEKLNHLKEVGATEEVVCTTMKDMGIQRATMYGWPNTYVFTKAMGEMILVNMKESVPIVIIRPTIITSTYKEPFPGWIQGTKAVDGVIVGYAKGRWTRFIGDPESILDLIPGDMVVNCIIFSMVAKVNQPSELIFHIGSSFRNPMILGKLFDLGFKYFSRNPWADANGNLVKVSRPKYFTTMGRFRFYMGVLYLIAQVLSLMNLILFGVKSDKLTRKIKYTLRLGELYEPYVFFKGTFTDHNTERLRLVAIDQWGLEGDLLCFNPQCIDWEEYFMKTHFPGMERYLLK